MDYIAASCALLAAIVGVVGNTWNRKSRGIRQITRTGWVVLTCAVVAFVVVVVQTHSRKNELQAALQTKEKYAVQAYSDIGRALEAIDHAFSALYTAYLLEEGKEEFITNSLDWPSALSWDQDRRGFLDYLSYLDITDSPGFGVAALDGESWAHFLSRKLTRARTGLETVLIAYGPYMTQGDVLAVDSLRTCELLEYVPELEDIYRRREIEPFFPVIWTEELGKAYVSLQRRLPEQDKP